MDYHRLRGTLLNLQDRLSDDDRKRLHFFLGNDVPRRIRDDQSLGGTLSLMESLFDQDKIKQNDVTLLIKAFDQIGCLDAARHLEEQMNVVNKPVQSLSILMPSMIDQLLNDEDNDGISVKARLVDERNIDRGKTCDTSLMFVDNTKRKFSVDEQDFPQTCYLNSKAKQCSRFYSVISIVLFILAIVEYFWMIHFKMKYDHIVNKHTENINILEDLENCRLKMKEISNKSIAHSEEEKVFSQGLTCGCKQWCNERGEMYGVCGNGHVCICRNIPITDDYIGDGCTCNQWCRTHARKSGGICGDGDTCICS
ncbi:hypothetical protein I4U23_012031 [Adineta vaga]|nr:hypothetical protein I4U23_012031 [Adineta vaga]